MTKKLFAFLLTLVLVLALGTTTYAGGGDYPQPPLRPRTISIEQPPTEIPCIEDYCNDDEQ